MLWIQNLVSDQHNIWMEAESRERIKRLLDAPTLRPEGSSKKGGRRALENNRPKSSGREAGGGEL
jgi:hypothetical protein